MKTIFIVAGLAFALVAVAGCGLQEEFQAEPSQLSVSGILIEQTAKDKEGGTHFIIGENEKKTSSRSLTINLSGTEYLNNKVKVSGILNQTDNVLEVTGISVVEILSKDTRQVQQLEYKDSEAGFRLTYFDDWKISSGVDNAVVFTAPMDVNAKTTIPAVVKIEQKPFRYEQKPLEDGSTKMVLEEYYEGLNEGKSLDLNTLSKIGVDQMPAIKTVSKGKIQYTLYRTGLIYDLGFVAGVPENAADEDVFNKMVSDFQFIEMEVVSDELITKPDAGDQNKVDPAKSDIDMTAFESLPYKFSGKYPSKWYYAGVKTTSDGDILHHYGFSDKVITKDNELIGLDVLSGALPTGGNSISFAGKKLMVLEGEGYYKVYTSAGDRNFRFVGSADYKEIMFLMAVSLSPTTEE